MTTTMATLQVPMPSAASPPSPIIIIIIITVVIIIISESCDKLSWQQ